MKHQALFSSKDKKVKKYSVVCCNFAWRFKAYLPNLPRENIFKAESVRLASVEIRSC